MQRLLLIGEHDWIAAHSALTHAGWHAEVCAAESACLRDAFRRLRPEAVVVCWTEKAPMLEHVRLVLRDELNTCPLPILCLVQPEHLATPNWIVGADDFLVAPFDSVELITRIRMLLWRFQRVDALDRTRIGVLEMDIVRRRVTVAGAPISLTPREYQLLRFLVTHRNRVLTRDLLLRYVWGFEFEGDGRVVDSYIKRLRRKLPTPCSELVETVHGVGYRLRDDATSPE